MTKYRYSDIPDEIITKEYYPLGRHLWRIFCELGPRFLMKWQMKYTESIDEIMKERLDSAVITAKAVIEDRIKAPKKTLSFQFFPALSMIRCDLLSGAMNQLYSGSADCGTVIVDDVYQEIFFCINTHIENGFPTNWWITRRDDEIFNYKDKKYGVKIRELPKHLKNLQKVGNQFLKSLKNVRNERNPEYTQSSYHINISYASNMANLITELSSYEGFNALWNALIMKTIHQQLKEHYMFFAPTPTFLKTLFYGGKRNYTSQMSRLTLDSKLAIHTVENRWQDFIKDELPELWDIGLLQQLRKGIPTPRMSLQSKSPNIADPKILKAEKFEFEYPHGEKITPEGLQISEEEIFTGVYLDVTPETPLDEKITKSHIISTGLGRKAKIL